MKMPRTEVDSSRRKAWAFTRLRHKGYPQKPNKKIVTY